MPKYRKDRKIIAEKEEKKREGVSEISLMYNTSVKTYVIALIFLGLSIIFNTELVRPFGTDLTALLKLIEFGFRGGLVIGFFLFAFLSWGNLKEVRGSIMGLKEIFILGAISLIQTVRNGYVVLSAVVGIILVCVYMWLMQVKVAKAS